MKKSTRALLGIVILDLLLFGAATWMVMQTRSGAWQSDDQPAAIQAITSTAAALIAIVTVLLLIAWARHKNRGN